jgi:hypothetical protein
VRQVEQACVIALLSAKLQKRVIYQHYPRCQASTAMLMRSVLFWGITQRRMVNSLPTFRYNVSVPSSRVKKSKNLDFFGLLVLWRWDRYVVPKCRQMITNRRCVLSQKNADRIYQFCSTNKRSWVRRKQSTYARELRFSRRFPEDVSLLECYSVSTGEWLQKFRRH